MYNKKQSEDALAWIYIGTEVYFGLQAIKKRDKLLEYLEADSLNPKRHQEFLTGLSKLKKLGNIDSEPVYRRVLEILINNSNNSQVIELAFRTGQWYFQSQVPSKTYTLDDLSQIQTLLIKKKELEDLIVKIDDDSEPNFIEVSALIDRLDFSGFEDNLVKSKVVNLKDIFFEKFSSSLLRRMTDKPTDKELHSLLRSTLEFISRPDPPSYEAFVVSLLHCVIVEPGNKELKAFLMYSLDKAPGIAGVNSLNIYNTVLDLFESSSSQKDLRVLVLEVGRWHFSRKNWLRRSPKSEDEQQMQNDILMRLNN